MYMKKLYTNGEFYNWSYRSICKKTGLSNTAVKKYVNYFIHFGWCKVIGKNLIFKNRKSTWDSKSKNIVKLDVSGDTTMIYQNMLLSIFKVKHNQCLRMSQKEIKSKGQEIGEASVSLSINRIALLFKCKKTKAHRIISALIKRSLLKVFIGRKTIRKATSDDISSCMGKYFKWLKGHYVSGGFLVKVECNKYFF